MRIVVTGAAGHLASHLIPLLLAADHDVLGIDLVSPRSTEMWRTAAYRSHPNFTYAWGDAADLVLPTDTGAVIHLAAVTDVRFAAASPLHTYGQIAMTTLQLAMRAAHIGVPHFLYVSTHSVYGPQSVPSWGLPELAPLRASTTYGAAKIAAEGAVRAMGSERGLPYTIVRPSALYGERERPIQLVSTFLRLAHERAVITLDGGGNQTRDLNYVGNVAAAIVHLLDHGSTNEAYNVGSGEEVRVRHLAELAVAAMGGGELRDGPVRSGEEGRLVLDSAKLADLGYMGTVDFKTGFERTVSWYKDHLGK